jgi:similar to spore coat protein
MAFIQNMTNALTGGNLSDQLIASDMLSTAKLGAIQLTMACLESSTMELRQVFQARLNECLTEHARLSKMSEERGWYKAHSTPSELLEQDMKIAQQSPVGGAQAQS